MRLLIALALSLLLAAPAHALTYRRVFKTLTAPLVVPYLLIENKLCLTKWDRDEFKFRWIDYWDDPTIGDDQ